MSLRNVVRGAVPVALLVLAGCGGSGGGGPKLPSPTPPPAVTSLVSSGSGPLNASTVAPIDFATSATGALDITVDWTFATNDVDIFLTRGTEPCTLQTFNNRSCGFIATEESTTLKPEKLHVSGLAAGAYTLYVANYGSTNESVAWQVLLTTGSAVSAPSALSTGRTGPAAKGPVTQIAEP